MTTIKYHAGMEVYWLSNRGFTKGVVKRVSFSEEWLPICGGKRASRVSLIYFLTDNVESPYRGDQVEEEKVFTSYEDMIAYYQKQKP